MKKYALRVVILWRSNIVSVQWGVFILFAGCVLAMTVSVYLFFPETKVT